MPNPITRDSLPLLFRAGLRKEFRDKWVAHKPNYPQWMKTESTTEVEEQAALITGPSRMYEIGDSQKVTYSELIMSDRVAAVDKEFGRGFQVTRKMVEDDKYGKALAGAKWLAHAAWMTQEYRAAQFLDDFFTGTTFKCYDGLAFGSAVHPDLSGPGLRSNIITTALSVTGFVALANIFTTMKDLNGDPCMMTPTKLVIGNDSAQLHRAIQIIQSEKEPFTNENQDNAIYKKYRNMEIVMAPYAASISKYYMISDEYNDVWFKMRRAPDTDDQVDFQTKNYQFTSTMRFMIYGVDWRGWAGANVT